MSDEIQLPVLSVKDGSVVANSRDVADYFGKQHKHVLRDIDSLINQAAEAGSNFGLSEYRDASGMSLRSFDMDRDGFTLLAMSFTGTTRI